MEFKPANLVKPAISIAAAGLGGALAGPVGLALGATLGGVFGHALGAAAEELVKSYTENFGDEAAKKLLEVGGESLADHLKPSAPKFDELCRKALLLSLKQIESIAPSGHNAWFKHWDKSLVSRARLDLTSIQTDLTLSGLEAILPRVLSILDAIGSGSPVPRDLPPELLSIITAQLPLEFPRAFNALIIQDEYAEAWKEAELAFRSATSDLLISIKEDTRSIKLDTARMVKKFDDLQLQKITWRTASARKPFNLPFGSIGDLFKGRDHDLEELEQRLQPQGISGVVQPACVTGMGGLGKTRLAIEYALRHEREFSAILFISASAKLALDSNLALLSSPDALDLPEYGLGNQLRQSDAVLQWFQEFRDWLLILDNADTKEAVNAVQELVPRLHLGRVLITSRISTWGGNVRLMDLDPISEEFSGAFLLERTAANRQVQPDDSVQVRVLARELGGLALALEQAAAYINERSITLAEYRKRWQQSSEQLLAFHDDMVMQYPRSVAVTFNTSVEQLSSKARQLLNILAWIAPEPVPRSLLETMDGPFARGNESGTATLDWQGAQQEAENALIDLVRFSLVSRSDDKSSFSVHRLVQAATRHRQADDEQRQNIAAALRWIDLNFVGDPEDARNWPSLELLAVHALTVATAADHHEIFEPTAHLMSRLAFFYKSRAEWSLAEPLYRRALALLEISHEHDDMDVGAALNNLANFLKDTKRFQEAEPLLGRALAIFQANLGPEDPSIAAVLINLGSLFQDTNRICEAEPIFRRALTISEKGFGPDHAEVAVALNNLAMLLEHTNRAQEAEPIFRRALAISEKRLGPGHPSVAARLNNLGLALHTMNRFAEAETLYRRALIINEKSLGPDHPIVGMNLNNLAEVLKDTKRLAEAEPLSRRHLEIFLNFTRLNGYPHPNLNEAIGHYAGLLKQMGVPLEQILARLHELGPEFEIALHDPSADAAIDPLN